MLRLSTVTLGFAFLLPVVAAPAQTALNRNAPVNPAAPAVGSPVDTNVADADPLSVSFRRVEPGNAQFSFAARLTVADFGNRWDARQDPATGLLHNQGYQYRAPGVRALIERPTYLARTLDGIKVNVQPDGDNRELAIIPANTVFQLTPEYRRRADVEPVTPPPPSFLDNRIDPRPERRITPQPPVAREHYAPLPLTADSFFPLVELDEVPTFAAPDWVVESSEDVEAR